MENRIIVIIALSMCLAICLCGCKSQEVKTVESMIASIGDVTLEKGTLISEAESAYNNLSQSDASKVENHNVLVSASFKYNELVEAGVAENIEKANQLYVKCDNLWGQFPDEESLMTAWTELNNTIELVPKDRWSEFDFEWNEKSFEGVCSFIKDLCYPETNLWRIEKMCGEDLFKYIPKNQTPSLMSDGWKQMDYNCTSSQTAQTAYYSYYSYLGGHPDVTDLHETNKISYQMISFYYKGKKINIMLGNDIVITFLFE